MATRSPDGFLRSRALAGILLLAAVVVALVWVNGPWSDAYERFVHASVSFGGRWLPNLPRDVHGWVNDGLMAVFFLAVGLEIKREFVSGELRQPRVAALPVLAALGGMLFPAALYLAITAGSGGDAMRGWGVPMATDIVFALGVLTLAGASAASRLRPVLLTLAVVDDIGGILVIAAFYTAGLAMWPLALALACVAVILGLLRWDLRTWPVCVALGLVCWYATLSSGIHPAIAGVALGLAVPATAARPGTTSPLERLEYLLLPWVGLLILPLFALVNAGVPLSSEAVRSALTSPVAIGIFVGLVVGKPLGIVLSAAGATRAGWARLPEGAGWGGITGIGVTAGIGFTVALFIAELAFPDPGMLADVKVAILAASVTAAILGWLVLRARKGSERTPPATGEERDPLRG